MIKLAAFADEASSSIEGQIAALKRNGIEYIELRGINGSNIAKYSLEEAEIYAKQLADAGIKVWAIGSAIGVISINADLEEHKNQLRHVCELARIFGTDKIIMFSCHEANDSEDKVFSELNEMVAIANEYGVGLYHENERAMYGNTLDRICRLIENVKGLHFVYDPSNFLQTGEDSSVTLEALHSKTDYFHIKDFAINTRNVVTAGYGDGRIAELIDRISPDVDMTLTVEPHLRVIKEGTEADKADMKNKFCYTTSDEAFDAAAQALIKIILEKGYSKVEGGYKK